VIRRREAGRAPGIRSRGLALVAATCAAASCVSCSGTVERRDVYLPAPAANPALSAAETAFGTARSAALEAVASLTSAATRLDSLDADCARGAFEAARALQARVRQEAATARHALDGLPAETAAYRTAVTGLRRAAAAGGVTAAGTRAVDAVVAAARAEATQVDAVVAGQRTGWAVYAQLLASGELWVSRAGAGFYPDPSTGRYDATRAGQAYVASTNPLRARLEAERSLLATTTTAVSRDSAAVSAALSAAAAALTSTARAPATSSTLPGD
jgi:hypothetical protein